MVPLNTISIGLCGYFGITFKRNEKEEVLTTNSLPLSRSLSFPLLLSWVSPWFLSSLKKPQEQLHHFIFITRAASRKYHSTLSPTLIFLTLTITTAKSSQLGGWSSLHPSHYPLLSDFSRLIPSHDNPLYIVSDPQPKLLPVTTHPTPFHGYC